MTTGADDFAASRVIHPELPAPAADLRERFVALQEFVEIARERLTEDGWGYLIGGTETEAGVLRNRHALDSLALRPRVLRDVSRVDASRSLFGRRARLPVILAPIGGLETFDADGAVAVARAAGRFGVPMMLSSVSPCTMQQVMAAGQAAGAGATATPGAGAADAAAGAAPAGAAASTDSAASTGFAMIYQLYVREPPAVVDALLEEAVALGSPAFCLTVDSAVYSRRERDIVARFVKPWRATGVGEARDYQASLNWSDIARLRKRHSIPLILKGIATGEDARLAVDHGVDVIHVSNHGGRQLDQVRGSMAVLPEVIAAVAGQARVVVDGSICRGTDIVKALALGADAVCIGRLMCAALAAAGSDGIVRMLELLEDELRIALALLGVCSTDDLDASHVQGGEPAVHAPSVWSAFPLLREPSLRAQ